MQPEYAMHLYEFEWTRSGLALMQVSIEPVHNEAARKLDAALFVMTRQDPGFGAFVADDLTTVILEGQGEPHLSAKLDELMSLLGVALRVGVAQVTYQEQTDEAGRLSFLQPIMRIEAAVTPDRIAAFVAELNARGGHVADVDLNGARSVLVAKAPLAGLFGFGAMLSGLVGDDAQVTMTFDGYAAVEPIG